MEKKLGLLLLVPILSLTFMIIPVASASSPVYFVKMHVRCDTEPGTPASYASLRYGTYYVQVSCTWKNDWSYQNVYLCIKATSSARYFAELKMGGTIETYSGTFMPTNGWTGHYWSYYGSQAIWELDPEYGC
jgi:hypothetical protein